MSEPYSTVRWFRQVVGLRMECEKLRCAALEAQGGLRQRALRAPNLNYRGGPSQQLDAR
jgi:hypothetical protein